MSQRLAQVGKGAYQAVEPLALGVTSAVSRLPLLPPVFREATAAGVSRMLTRTPAQQAQERAELERFPAARTAGAFIGNLPLTALGLGATRMIAPALSPAISRLPLLPRLLARGAEFAPTAGAIGAMERADLERTTGIPITGKDVALAAALSAAASVPAGVVAEALGTAGRAINQAAYRKLVAELEQGFLKQNPTASQNTVEQFRAFVSRGLAERGIHPGQGAGVLKTARAVRNIRQGKVRFPEIPPEGSPTAKPATTPQALPAPGTLPPRPVRRVPTAPTDPIAPTTPAGPLLTALRKTHTPASPKPPTSPEATELPPSKTPPTQPSQEAAEPLFQPPARPAPTARPVDVRGGPTTPSKLFKKGGRVLYSDTGRAISNGIILELNPSDADLADLELAAPKPTAEERVNANKQFGTITLLEQSKMDAVIPKEAATPNKLGDPIAFIPKTSARFKPFASYVYKVGDGYVAVQEDYVKYVKRKGYELYSGKGYQADENAPGPLRLVKDGKTVGALMPAKFSLEELEEAGITVRDKSLEAAQRREEERAASEEAGAEEEQETEVEEEEPRDKTDFERTVLPEKEQRYYKEHNEKVLDLPSTKKGGAVPLARIEIVEHRGKWYARYEYSTANPGGSSPFYGAFATRAQAIAEGVRSLRSTVEHNLSRSDNTEAVQKQFEKIGKALDALASPPTQKERVKEAVAEEPKSIEQVQQETGIKRENIRRILGEGARAGEFERVGKGVYVLTDADGRKIAHVETADALEALKTLNYKKEKFDMIFLDPPYFSRALVGGNRGIKDYEFVNPGHFQQIVYQVSQLMRTPDTHVYLMLSGARTAQPDMDQYLGKFNGFGFTVVGEGRYTKLTKSGARVTNVRGEPAAPERLILLTKSGTAKQGEIPVSLEFAFVRPSIAKSYATEKPLELLRAIVKQSTLEGESVLDPFAGSGVTGEAAVSEGRSVTLIEKKESQAGPIQARVKKGLEGRAAPQGGPRSKSSTPKYAIDQDDYNAVVSQHSAGRAPVETTRKVLPPTTATNLPIDFPKEGGRHIEDIYEREVGPVLQLSARMRKWLGVYYGGKGTGSGLIRLKTLENQQTLAHETGHFLDDVMGESMTLKPKSPEQKELLAVTQHLRPFNEERVPMLDKDGNPILTKKGVQRTRQSSYTAYRRSREELFADYVSLYIADAAKAKELAPLFTARVEAEIAKDKEFAYIVKKMREYDAAFKPLKEFVAGLRTIPQINPLLKPWEERGVLLENVWRDLIGNKLWARLERRVKQFGKTFPGRQLTEQRGLDDTTYTILTQRRKLIDGQTLRVQEVLIEPISQLSKDDQEWMSKALERFETVDPANPMAKLTEEARKELAVWGNEARRLGLLNDFTFWNNVGQYFPYFYETKEFAANKAKFGTTFLTKALRANLSSYKHRLTDEQMGQKALEARYTTFPSGKAKIAAISREEKIALGKKIREEMKLMRTTAYPLKVRIGRMIQSVYTTKALNALADIPGIVGTRQSSGYVRLPEGKSLGNLSGQWVPEAIAREINAFTPAVSEIGKVVDTVNAVWKSLKVPYDPSAVSRNAVSNALSLWLADIPIWDPNVIGRGVTSFLSKDATYQALRDHGLYKHTYSAVEMQSLAFAMESEPETTLEAIVKWAAETFQIPGQLYGAIEDVSKTVAARYIIERGGSVEQAVQLADKWLFDYSSVSPVVGAARRTGWPFITWSAKIFPRLVEVAVRKPEKYAFFYALLAALGAMSRLALELSRDEEEALKPKWAKGPRHALLLLPFRDANDEVNWINLDYFLPWGGWLNPIKQSPIGLPQPLQAGNPFIILYNAWVQNYDPFLGQIAEPSLPKGERILKGLQYTARGLTPDLLGGRGFENIVKAVTGKPDYAGRTPSLGREVLKEAFGLSVIAGGESTTKARNAIEDLTQRRTDINRKAREAATAYAEHPTAQGRLEMQRALQAVHPQSRAALQRDAILAVRFKKNPLALSLLRATSNEQKVEILRGARSRFSSVKAYIAFLQQMLEAKIISPDVTQRLRRRP